MLDPLPARHWNFERAAHLPETTRLRYELLYLATKYDFDNQMKGLREYLALVPAAETAQVATDSADDHSFALAELGWNFFYVYRDPALAEEFKRRQYILQRRGGTLSQVADTLLLQGKLTEIDALIQDYQDHLQSL